jgi:hypothetical protein
MGRGESTLPIPTELLEEIRKRLFATRGVPLSRFRITLGASAQPADDYGTESPRPALVSGERTPENVLALKILKRSLEMVANDEISMPISLSALTAFLASRQGSIGSPDRPEREGARLKTKPVPAHLIRKAKPREPMGVEWDETLEEIREALRQRSGPDHGNT